MSDYTLYLRDLLDAPGLERPVVAGHSLGGWMALELAVWYPERVGRLVLSNSAGIRVKGHPIADLFAMNPQETLAVCFDDVAAASLIPPIYGETLHRLIAGSRLVMLDGTGHMPTAWAGDRWTVLRAVG